MTTWSILWPSLRSWLSRAGILWGSAAIASSCVCIPPPSLLPVCQSDRAMTNVESPFSVGFAPFWAFLMSVYKCSRSGVLLVLSFMSALYE